MTTPEAEDMLKQLAKHYGEPVMPVSRYCRKLEQWANLVGNYLGDDRQRQLRVFRNMISKSNLLARLIYANEEPRTEKCPIHEGHWAGIYPEPCPHGCDYTGWLPNSPERTPQ